MAENFSGYDVYLFFTFRGILDNYSGFVYDPDVWAAQEELSKEYFQVEKLRDNWYFCASRQ